MAKMLTLDPAITLALSEDWNLLVSEAGRYADGLRASIALAGGASNGAFQTVEQLTLPDVKQREAFAQRIGDRCGLAVASVEAQLMKVFDAVERHLRQQTQESEEAHQSQATRLVELVHAARVELFHTPDGVAYGSIPIEDHVETYPLRVRSFRRWMERRFYEQEEKTPGSQSTQDALNVLEGQALFTGPELPVFVRLAEHQGAIYLDLCNERWQAVEVTTAGWRIVDTYPVRFRRMPGMLPLPLPVAGGNLGQLRALLNLGHKGQDSDWRLVAHWLLAALRPRGPYPILVVHGGHGSAKSTLARVLRSCLDPNTAPLRRPPRDDHNIAIAASNSWIVAYDNLSDLANWLSDVLCCVSTGLGFATRSLYTDGEEALFQAMRPIVVNGIEEVATRADFLDRVMIVHLPAMQAVKDEETFWEEVERARPQILGALLTIVSQGLKALPTVRITMPRMADFAKWSCATAPACGWTGDDFIAAYKDVRESTYMLTLEASLLWPPLQKLLADKATWEGKATELLYALTLKVEEDIRKQKEWPKKPHILSNALRRLQPTLKEVKIVVTFDRDETAERNRIIKIVSSR